MIFRNADWLYRHMDSHEPLHFNDWGDSLTVPGGSTTFCSDFLGDVNQYQPEIVSGIAMPDALASPFLPIKVNVQIVTSDMTGGGSTYDGSVNPGEAAASNVGGNTDGRTVGTMAFTTYGSDRGDTGLIAKRELLDSSWPNGQHFYLNRPMRGRLLILQTPNGIPNLKLVAKRNGTIVATTQFSAKNATERMVAVNVDIPASNSTASLEISLVASTGDESAASNNYVQWGSFFLHANETYPRGWFYDSFSVGGWSAKAYATSDTIGGYTARLSDAGMQASIAATQIAGVARRVYRVRLGQNDGGYTKAQYAANMATYIGRLTANHIAATPNQPHAIWLSPPSDPGPTLDPRFDDYEDACLTLSDQLSTDARPIMAQRTRLIVKKIGNGGNGTMAGVSADLIADGVHKTQKGSVALAALEWAELMAQRRVMVGGIGGRRKPR